MSNREVVTPDRVINELEEMFIATKEKDILILYNDMVLKQKITFLLGKTFTKEQLGEVMKLYGMFRLCLIFGLRKTARFILDFLKTLLSSNWSYEGQGRHLIHEAFVKSLTQKPVEKLEG